MDNAASKDRPVIAVWLPRLATATVFALSLGFLLHTSAEPLVFGKYNWRYATFLGILFLGIVPAFYRLARFCAVTDVMQTASGRRVTIRPRNKLAVIVLLTGGAYLGANAAIDRQIHTQTLSYSANVFHPYLQNVPTPGNAAEHVNRWGFRGDDIQIAKSDDTFRIFVFGGSTVYCGTVPYEQTHCRMLERRLQAAYPQYRIEVQNLGAEWHTTEHETTKLLFLAQDFSPDMAIMFHGINDLVRSLSPDMFAAGPYWPDYRHYLGAASGLVDDGSKLPLFVRAASGYWCSDLRFDQVRLDGPDGNGLRGMHTMFYPKAREVEITEWPSLPSFRRNLRDFATIAQSKGIRVLLATQPSLYRDDLTPAERQLLGFPLSHYFDGKRASLHSMVEGMRRFNDATHEVARETGVAFVDLEGQMPKTTAYLYDDIHYTPVGNELIADAFAEAIIGAKVIDRVMDERREERNPSPRFSPGRAAALRADRR
ncbi:MAG TPA: SGNH/GDSL hydrolase family protein [Pirellulales bacterium]|nr:SGNH/GDSL hydrolase family protein [Pirellulales bacterium]